MKLQQRRGLLPALVALGVLTALMLSLSGCGQDAESESSPREQARTGPAISFEPMEIDLGKMRQSEDRSVEAVIRNVGTEELVIDKVGTSCGCTVAALDVKVLAPGEATTMQIDFNSKKFSGKVTKRVTVTSNDPVHHQRDLLLTVEVITPVMIEPNKRALANRNLPHGTVWSDKVTFTTRDVEKLEVSLVDFESDAFTAVIENGVGGDPRKSVMTVSTPQNLAVGMHDTQIAVNTNVPEAGPISIRVHARVVGDLRIEPRVINFGVVEGQQEIEKSVTIRTVNSEAPFEITSAKIDLPGLDVRVETVQAGEEYLLVLSGHTLPASDRQAIENKGRVRGILKVETTRNEEPELMIRTQYLLRL